MKIKFLALKLTLLALALSSCGAEDTPPKEEKLCDSKSCQELANYLHNNGNFSVEDSKKQAAELQLSAALRRSQTQEHTSKYSSLLKSSEGEEDFIVCASAYVSAVTRIGVNKCYSITYAESIKVSFRTKGYTAGIGIGFTIIIYKRFLDENLSEQVYGNLDEDTRRLPTSDDFKKLGDINTAKDILLNSEAMGISLSYLINIQLIIAHNKKYGRLLAGSAKFAGIGLPFSLTALRLTIKKDEDSEKRDHKKEKTDHRKLIQVGAFTIESNAIKLIAQQKELNNYCRKFPYLKEDGQLFFRVKCVRPLVD